MTIDSIRSCLKDHSSVVFRYNSEYYSLREKNLLFRTVYILVGTDMIPQQRDSLEGLCDQVYISDGIRLSAAFARLKFLSGTILLGNLMRLLDIKQLFIIRKFTFAIRASTTGLLMRMMGKRI